jgi:hypothetical protein
MNLAQLEIRLALTAPQPTTRTAFIHEMSTIQTTTHTKNKIPKIYETKNNKKTKQNKKKSRCKLAIVKRKVPYWQITRTSQGVSIPVSPSCGERFNPLAIGRWFKIHFWSWMNERILAGLILHVLTERSARRS